MVARNAILPSIARDFRLIEKHADANTVVGTLAQTIKAGIPHLVVPNGHDQFDNGWRIERLGLGRSTPQTRYRARTVAQTIRALLAEETISAR